jgi:chromosome segregation ATPase
MDYDRLFREALEKGLSREDIIRYLAQLEEETKNAEQKVQTRINSLNSARDELSGEVSQFSDHVEDLEKQLEREKERVRKLTAERDQLYAKLETTEMELDRSGLMRQQELEQCEKEIAEFLEEKKRLQEQLRSTESKAQKYEEMRSNLKRLRAKAEYEAYSMVETAKEQSMDAVSVVDDLSQEITVFQSDLGKIKEDFKIGTATLEDRLDALYYALEHHVETLQGIKIRFYKKHRIPVEESSYDYVAIASSDQAHAVRESAAPQEEVAVEPGEGSLHRAQEAFPPPAGELTGEETMFGEAAEEPSSQDYI